MSDASDFLTKWIRKNITPTLSAAEVNDAAGGKLVPDLGRGRMVREQPNVLDGKGFQPSQKAHSPCFCENLPASSEWREDARPEFNAMAPRRARPPGDAEREPRNGVGFARDGVDWFLSTLLGGPSHFLQIIFTAADADQDAAAQLSQLAADNWVRPEFGLVPRTIWP